MADSEELKLRIVPEIDGNALKKIQAELDKLKVPAMTAGGGKSAGGSGSTTTANTAQVNANTQAVQKNTQAVQQNVNAVKQQNDALKNELKTIRARIDLQDLQVRTVRANAEREIESLQQKAAANQITTTQMNQGIIAQQTLVENAEAQARAEYLATGQALENLSNKYGQNTQAIINRQKQLFYANERLESGFNSMSGSMQQVVSNTKNANLAFMNFGRIVQDAPFGLIGIANNIDPLLNSFNQLKMEVGGTGAALKAMGRQLLGPAGIIFLLGSALPTALLFFQKMQKDATKEADALAEALKRVADEFGRLAAQAASKRGISQVNSELQVTTKTLEIVSKELSDIEQKIEDQVTLELARVAATNQGVVAASEIRKRLEEQNKELLFRLRTEKLSLESNKEKLEVERQDIQAQEVINKLKEEGRVAASLSLEEQYDLRKRLKDLEIESLELTDKAQAELLRRQEELRDKIRKIWNDVRLRTSAEGIFAIRTFREELSNLQKGISTEAKNTSEYIDRTVGQQALLRIAYENNLYLAKDENLTWEQRQKYFDQAILSRKAELNLQIQSAEQQRAIETDEAKILGYNVELIELRQEMRLIDREITEFAQKRVDAAFKMISAMEEQIRLLEEASIAEMPTIDIDTDNLSRRLDLAKESIDLQTQYKINSEISAGNRIKALEMEKQAFINSQYQEYLNARYSEEEAMMMAQSDAAKEYALAERDMRKEVTSDIFQATGELASQALTAIFGDNKKVAIAQVIIDTIMGIQKIWSQSGINPIVGGLASAALAAKGVASIQKIKNTDVGSGSVSNTQQKVVYVTNQDGMERSESMFLKRPSPSRPLLGASTTASMMGNPFLDRQQPINVTANVDRRGLAIAVREGERNLRTQQFDYR